MVISPFTRAWPICIQNLVCICSGSPANCLDAAGFQISSTRLSAVFTPWPPGPDERENRQVNSAADNVSDALIRSGSATPSATGWAVVTEQGYLLDTKVKPNYSRCRFVSGVDVSGKV